MILLSRNKGYFILILDVQTAMCKLIIQKESLLSSNNFYLILSNSKYELAVYLIIHLFISLSQLSSGKWMLHWIWFLFMCPYVFSPINQSQLSPSALDIHLW